jgi:hypothetical protein
VTAGSAGQLVRTDVQGSRHILPGSERGAGAGFRPSASVLFTASVGAGPHCAWCLRIRQSCRGAAAAPKCCLGAHGLLPWELLITPSAWRQGTAVLIVGLGHGGCGGSAGSTQGSDLHLKLVIRLLLNGSRQGMWPWTACLGLPGLAHGSPVKIMLIACCKQSNMHSRQGFVGWFSYSSVRLSPKSWPQYTGIRLLVQP